MDDQVIVVDGGSTDNTAIKAQEALRDFSNSKIISEPDNGIYDAWNKALKYVENDWVVFLGCGDILRISYRNEMKKAIHANPNANLIHSIAQFTKNGREGKILMSTFGRKFNKEEFKNRMRICHVGALHHKSLFANRDFDTRYRCVSDYKFLLQQIDTLNPVFVNKVLVEMDSDGISSQLVFPYWEELKMKNDLGGYNLFSLFHRFIYAVLRRFLFNIREWAKYRS